MASPSDVAGLVSWWRADTITGLVDGDPAGTFPDSATSPNDATQGTAGSKPLYKTAIINGLPVLRFDGVDDFMASAAVSNTATQTLFTVIVPSTSAATRTIRGCSSDGLQWRVETDDKQGLVRQATTFIASSTGTVTEGSSQVLAASYSDTADTYAFFKNGTADGNSTTAVALGAGGITTVIGRNGSSSAEYLVGDVAEIIVYNSVLSAGDRAIVHTYVQDKYAITVSDYVPSVFTNKSAMRQMLNYGRM